MIKLTLYINLETIMTDKDTNTPSHNATKKDNTVEARHLIEQDTGVTARLCEPKF